MKEGKLCIRVCAVVALLLLVNPCICSYSTEIGDFFNSIDNNADGQVEEQEVVEYIQSRAGGAGYTDVKDLVAAADHMILNIDSQDADATLSFSEFDKHLHNVLSGTRVWEWIKHGVGLGQYAEAFKNHSIVALDFFMIIKDDGRVLVEDLGVTSAFHKRKLMNAIYRQLLALGTPPSQPLDLTCIITASNDSIISWKPPTSLGDPPLHKYVLEVSDHHSHTATSWETVSEPEDLTRIVHNGVRPHAQYRVVAWNLYGSSPYTVTECVHAAAGSTGFASNADYLVGGTGQEGVGVMPGVATVLPASTAHVSWWASLISSNILGTLLMLLVPWLLRVLPPQLVARLLQPLSHLLHPLSQLLQHTAQHTSHATHHHLKHSGSAGSNLGSGAHSRTHSGRPAMYESSEPMHRQGRTLSGRPDSSQGGGRTLSGRPDGGAERYNGGRTSSGRPYDADMSVPRTSRTSSGRPYEGGSPEGVPWPGCSSPGRPYDSTGPLYNPNGDAPVQPRRTSSGRPYEGPGPSYNPNGDAPIQPRRTSSGRPQEPSSQSPNVITPDSIPEEGGATHKMTSGNHEMHALGSRQHTRQQRSLSGRPADPSPSHTFPYGAPSIAGEVPDVTDSDDAHASARTASGTIPYSSSCPNLVQDFTFFPGSPQSDSSGPMYHRAAMQQHAHAVEHSNTVFGYGLSALPPHRTNGTASSPGKNMCGFEGCCKKIDVWHLKSHRMRHYCGRCQSWMCIDHTAYSPHGATGSCGQESRCVCVRCIWDFTPEYRAFLAQRNTLPRKPAPTAPSTSVTGTAGGLGGVEGMGDKEAMQHSNTRILWGRASTKIKAVVRFKGHDHNQ